MAGETETAKTSEPALALVRSLKSIATDDAIFLFPSDKPGQPLTEIKKFWKSVCAEAELDAVRIHDLRHTFASSLVSRGISLHIVGRLLGHTQPQTTARYAHVDDAALRAATEGFGAIVENGQNIEAEVVDLEPGE